MVMSTVRESGWSVPVAMAEEDMQSNTEEEEEDMDDAAPVHPVPTMQGAFEESMTETIDGEDADIPDRYSKADSVTRRKMLLEQDQYERTVAGRWKQKPGEKFHPLWKLVAQISFGMHLLQQGLAKSDEEVLKILQTHVDEVDGFLERTTEDFDLAQGDINERIRYLKLPLEHGSVFDQMLADRAFRVAIVEGNEKIEHIIDRTAAAMNDALKDVQKGLDATRELAKYMTRVDKQWEDRTEEHDSVYLAMIGNTEGWTRAFLTLQSKGGHLRKALVQLGGIVAEMQRRAGAASRKNLVPARSATERYNIDTRSGSPQTQHPGTPPRSPMKPLPTAPDSTSRGAGASTDKYIRSPQHDRSKNNSPYLGQSATMEDQRKPSIANEPMQRARSPNPPRSARSPDPSRGGKSSEMGGHSQAQQKNAKSPNLGVPGRDMAPLRNIGSPEPPRNRSFDSPRSGKSPEPSREGKSPEPTRNLRNPEPGRSSKTASPLPELGSNGHSGKSSEKEVQLRTPAEVMAQMNEASKPAMPQRSHSRRRSFMDGTKSLLRKKPSLQLDEEFSRSGTILPIQSPSTDGSPAKHPSSPGSIFRRLSSRRAHAMSMSHYSGSPTSTKFSTTPPRHDSPAHTRNGTRVPTQSSYGGLLPTLEQISPFGASFANSDIPEIPPVPKPVRTSTPPQNPKVDLPSKAKLPQIAPLRNFTSVPDDSGGSVNTAHPLLREARHANFSSRTGSNSGSTTPTGGDTPFKGYQPTFAHSNPDLSQRSADSMIPPKRTSSLVHDGNNINAPILNDSAVDKDKRSPTPTQAPPNSSSLTMLTRANTAPPAELGIHPAHRHPETTTEIGPSPSSPTLSNLSDLNATGATPPPIATGRTPDLLKPSKSPTARFPTQPPRLQTQNHPAPKSVSQPTSAIDPAAYLDPHPGSPVQISDKFPTTSPNSAPFYLNPASSTALVDFLSTSPPPSPPLAHPGTRTEPGTPASQSASHFFSRPFNPPSSRPGEASPPPPAPGSSRGGRNELAPWERDEGRAMTMQSTGFSLNALGSLGGSGSGGTNGVEKERKGSAGSGLKGRFLKMREKVETGRIRDRGRGKGDKDKNNGGDSELGNGSPRVGDAEGGEGEGGEKGGFMGVGKDGNWISRKNFIKG